MEEDNFLIRSFDSLLHYVSRGITHEQIEQGVTLLELEKVKEWKSKNGYLFNIYGNDHFIDNKPHFHFDHKEKQIACKIGFDGEIFESKGKTNPDSKIIKELKYFLDKDETQKALKNMWNTKNPELQIA